MTEFGLTTDQAQILHDIFAKHLTQGKIVIYGSRAMGNFTPRSDIDIVIQSAGTTDRHLLADIHEQIDESNFPYLCDIQYIEEIKNPTLKDHIQQVGKVFFEKSQ